MAALAAALGSGLEDPTEFDLSSLAKFQGVKRRQEVLAETENTTLITDFAHHPTAIRDTLSSLKKRFPDRKVVMCFEARSNTSCRKVHETEFELAFDLADEIHLGSVFRAERYASSERIDLDGMAHRLGDKAVHHSSNEVLEEVLLKRIPSMDQAVVVFFSNGSFDGVPLRLASAISP